MHLISKFFTISKYSVYIFFIIIISSNDGLCQIEYSAEEIIQKVQKHFDAINDCYVKLKIIVDIPNLRMPKKNLKYYYKKPDKYLVKTSGFAIIPKAGIFPAPGILLKEGGRAEYLRTEKIDEITCHLIHIINNVEKDENPEITMWVDEEQWLIKKIELTIPGKKISDINFVYKNVAGFQLPDSVKINLSFDRGIPKAHRPDISKPFQNDNFESKYKEENLNGNIFIKFSDFKINTGLKDSIFEEE